MESIKNIVETWIAWYMTVSIIISGLFYMYSCINMMIYWLVCGCSIIYYYKKSWFIGGTVAQYVFCLARISSNAFAKLENSASFKLSISVVQHTGFISPLWSILSHFVNISWQASLHADERSLLMRSIVEASNPKAIASSSHFAATSLMILTVLESGCVSCSSW